MSTCFFIGHRDVSDSVLSALEQEVERHITEYGITDFVVGHYGRFDKHRHIGKPCFHVL